MTPPATASSAANRLIVALDVPTGAAARTLADQLDGAVGTYKIGHELIFGGDGMDLAREMAAAGRSVFLDAKLLDIPNTVEKAVMNLARLGLDMVTVHATDAKTLAAAVRGRDAVGGGLKLLAVTVLTSVETADLVEQGIAEAPADLVLRRAGLARDAGFDGIVASGQEAAAVRADVGPDMLIVTPGIRPAGSAAGDQARVMTPADAIAAGATHLVVGRPITAASDPRGAAEAIAAEVAAIGV